MSMHSKSAILTALVVAMIAIGNAFAATSTSNMGVSANVSADCTIAAAPLSFGTYDPITSNSGTGVDATATANLSVVCTSGSTANITLGQGLNPDAGSSDDAPLRQMANGPDLLTYSIYQDPSHTTIWGNSPDTSVSYEGTGSASNVTVYGVAPRGQGAPAGSYNDTVVATITF